MSNTTGTGDGSTGSTSTRAKGRWRRRITRLVLALLVLLIIGVAFAPMLVGSFGPGIIEGKINPTIPGKIKVGSLSLGWFSDVSVGPMELRDDAGKVIATARVKAPVSLWRIVREGWWSRRSFELGEVTASATADVVRGADGVTNIERALGIKPAPQAAPKPAPTGGPAPGAPSRPPVDLFKAALRLEGVGVTFTDQSAPAGSASAKGIGVKDFGGPITVEYRTGANGKALLKTDLTGAIISGGAALPERPRIATDIDVDLGPSGAPIAGGVKLDISGVPADLVDVLADLGGTLAPSIGPKVDVKVHADGNLDRAAATLAIVAKDAGVDLSAKYDGSRLTLEKPGRIWAKSTGFVAGAKALRPMIERAGSTVRLDAAPGVDVTIASLNLPLTRQMLTGAGGGAGGGGGGASAIDLRGSTLAASISLDGVTGKVSPEAVGEAATGAAAAWKPFKTQPLQVVVDAPDLGKGVDLLAKAAAEIDGQPAGTLDVKVHAGGVLDAAGNPAAGLPRKIDADVRLAGASTAILQPMLAGMDLPVNLAQDLGPSVDAVITASAAGEPDASGLPPTSVDLRVTSANTRATARVRVDKGLVSTRDDGVSVKVQSAGPLLKRLVRKYAPDAAEVSGAGGIELSVRDLSAPVDERSKDPSNIAGIVQVKVADLGVRPILAAPPPSNAAGAASKPSVPAPIMISNATAGLTLGTAGPRASLNAAMSHGGSPFSAAADLAVPGFFSQWPLRTGGDGAALLRTVNAWRPQGKVEITDLPASLTAIAPALAPPMAPPAADDVASQVQETVRRLAGSPVNATVTLAPDKAAKATKVAASVRNKAVGLDSEAQLGDAELVVSRVYTFAFLKREDVQGVLTAVTPAGQGVPMRLHEQAALDITVDPIRLPLKSGEGLPVDLGKLGTVSARATLKGGGLDNVPIAGHLRSVGTKDLAVTVAADGGSLLAGGNAKQPPARVVVNGTLVNLSPATPQEMGKLLVDTHVPLADPASAALAVRLGDVVVRQLDDLLDQRGALLGALGDKAEVTLNVTPKGKTMLVEAAATSPRLTVSPMKLSLDDERITMNGGSNLKWTPDMQWLNARAFPPAAGAGSAGGVGAARLDMSQQVTVGVALEKLVLSRSKFDAAGAQTQGYLKPGVFELGAVVSSPKIVMYPGGLDSTGRERPPVALEGIRASTWTAGQKPGALAADLAIGAVREGTSATPTGNKSALKLTLSNLADDRGIVTSDHATIDANGEIRGFPTPILDMLGNQGGLLTETLGPVVNLTVQADKASMEGGSLRARMNSQRAAATLGGDIRAGAFVQKEPIEIKLTEITPNLVQSLAGSIPVVATLQKSPKDEPAIIKAENLTVPLDKDLSKLNGTVRVDPGVAQFTTTGPFQQILKFASLKESGQVGRRLDPFVVTAVNGVLTYDRFKLALGEFNIETRGTVDLVGRRIDVVTYAPFFALTDEAAGLFNTNLAGRIGRILPGGVIERTTMIPIRTHGSMDGPKTEVDMEMFFKESGKNLLNAPGDLIDGILGGKKKKDEKK